MYYEDLSIWDTAGNYDQIGITSDYNAGGTPSTPTDAWQVDWVNVLCGAFGPAVYGTNWSATAYSLTPGTSYTFEMALSGTDIIFNVYDGWTTYSPTLVYSHTISDSATYFYKEGNTSAAIPECGAMSNSGYTDFQEVYYLNVQPFPNWDFNFSNNHASGL
jgi:hypothetical protein